VSSIHFESAKGRAVLKYPNEVMAQEQYVDVCNDGTIYFSANPEVGNAIPVKVWDGHIRRISFNRSISETMTKVMRKQFYKKRA
jgi:hypothetical protein